MTILIILSICSAILYRAGGGGDESRQKFPWLPHWFFNTKARDIGCALCRLIAILILGISAPWYIHFVSFILTFAALTTYWDFLFGHDNFYAHGFVIGVATLPYVFFSPDVNFLAWGMQCIALSVFMGLWCKLWGWDIAEEGGRGGSIPLSAIILTL